MNDKTPQEEKLKREQLKLPIFEFRAGTFDQGCIKILGYKNVRC